jgi:hypothetical protein
MAASICDVLPSAAALLGVPSGDDRLALAGDLGGVRRVLVLLVDGMGTHLLPSMAPHAPTLAAVLGGQVGALDELSSTFPSTTPTSLVSLATGVPPGMHGVVGFTVRVPGTRRILTHITWADDPSPALWQPVPTWFERTAAAGVPTRVVLPAVFKNSGLTVAAYRGAQFIGAGTRDDYAQLLVDHLLDGPGLLYGYTAELDTAAHRFGIDSPQWQVAARGVDRLLARLIEALPDDAALLVTADHGGVNVGPDTRFDLGTDARLGAGVDLVAGEPRVRYLHTERGATADVVAAWRAVLGREAEVVTRDEAVDSGLFGPVTDAHLARLGDVVVVCTGGAAVLATGYEPPEVAKLIGFHGSLTPLETAIPLLRVRG